MNANTTIPAPARNRGAAGTPAEQPRALIAEARPHVCLVSAELGWDFIHDLTTLPDAPPVLAYASAAIKAIANDAGNDAHGGVS